MVAIGAPENVVRIAFAIIAAGIAVACIPGAIFAPNETQLPLSIGLGIMVILGIVGIVGIAGLWIQDEPTASQFARIGTWAASFALVIAAIDVVYFLIAEPSTSNPVLGTGLLILLLIAGGSLLGLGGSLQAAEWRPSRGIVLLAVAAAVLAILVIAGLQPDPRLVGLIAIVLLAGALVGLAQWAPESGYFALLMLTSPLAPGIAGVTAVWLHIATAPGPPNAHDWNALVHPWSVVIGIGAAIVVWVVGAYMVRHLATAPYANPSAYAELQARMAELRRRAPTDPADPLRVEVEAIGDELADGGQAAKWVTADGYIGLWRRIHRVEEALIDSEPVPRLAAIAMDLKLRLDGSRISNRETLAEELRKARESIDADQVDQPAVDRSRPKLAYLRRSINEYRDDRWAGLVSSRNGLIKSVTFAAITGLVALGLAMVAGASREAMIATGAIYLVGALTALLKRLSDEPRGGTVIEDYGLWTARVVHAPLLGGVAALGGVFLLAMLASIPGADNIVSGVVPFESSPPAAEASAAPAPSADAGEAVASAEPQTDGAPSASVDTRYPAVSSIFSLVSYPFGIVLAAIFGLTPTLLLKRLQALSDKYAADLKGSESAETTAAD